MKFEVTPMPGYLVVQTADGCHDVPYTYDADTNTATVDHLAADRVLAGMSRSERNEHECYLCQVAEESEARKAG